mmetsp:Transcript_17031/g.37868  ORF Transcript_17031/g.37868 Transcript_17031/m.37868 type:complete len:439 (+) Transcript_17031:62-1378(+)
MDSDWNVLGSHNCCLSYSLCRAHRDLWKMLSAAVPFWALCFLSAGLAHAVEQISGNYSLVLVGGGLNDDNTEVWSKIIELGGGEGVARFGVISAASENPCCDEDSSWVYYRDLLTLYGAQEVYYIPITVNSTEANSDPEVEAHVRTLTGFFFGGGDQLRIIESFYNKNARVPSPVLQTIREQLLRTGGVVAGTSAGTDCQTSSVMITGGESYQGLVKGATIFWEPVERKDPNLLTGYGPGGIGLFEHGLIDTHFANRGRQGRLVKLLLDSMDLPHGHRRSFGVDENTALVVTGDWKTRRGEVLGQRGVWVFDVESAVQSDGDVIGVAVSRISRGDGIDLHTLSIQPASYKLLLLETNPEVETSKDIFGADVFEFDKISLSLLQSTQGMTTGVTAQSPQIKVTIAKQRASAGESAGYGGIDPSTGDFAYAFSNLRMDVA